MRPSQLKNKPAAGNNAGGSGGSDASVGVGLRAAHYRDFLAQPRQVGWLEVHSENFFHLGGWDFEVLTRLRRDYPVSLHGVGLGLGSAYGFSLDHLHRLRGLVERIEPVLVSEHLCWHAIAGRHLNDLLPLTLDRASFALVAARIDQVQEVLQRRILVENVSTYLRYRDDAVSEAAFLAELAATTGCGIVLDVNNLYVNQCNHGEDALAAIATVAKGAPGAVGEIHLGGHLLTPAAVIDHHGAAVAAPVWDLYRAALAACGPVATLVEWDTEVPPLPVLLAEADKAGAMLALAAMPAPASRSATPLIWTTLATSAALPASSQQGFVAALFDPAASTTQFAETAHLAERLALHRGQLSGTWHKTLAAAYPVLQQLLGAAFFEGLSRDFGLACPPLDADLHRFGAGLPDYLAGFDAAADYPYLPDLARLEWALHRAHYAPDAAALGAQHLAQLDAAQFAQARLRLHPAASLLDAPWAIASLWRAHQTDLTYAANASIPAAWPDQLDQRETVAVSRSRWRARMTPVTPAAFAALQIIAGGASIGQALAGALAIDPQFDFGSHLQQWLALELFAAAEPAPP